MSVTVSSQTYAAIKPTKKTQSPVTVTVTASGGISSSGSYAIYATSAAAGAAVFNAGSISAAGAGVKLAAAA